LLCRLPGSRGGLLTAAEASHVSSEDKLQAALRATAPEAHPPPPPQPDAPLPHNRLRSRLASFMLLSRSRKSRALPGVLPLPAMLLLMDAVFDCNLRKSRKFACCLCSMAQNYWAITCGLQFTLSLSRPSQNRKLWGHSLPCSCIMTIMKHQSRELVVWPIAGCDT
jgi:hypothetical protein